MIRQPQLGDCGKVILNDNILPRPRRADGRDFMNSRIGKFMGAVALGLVMASPAIAQKAKDTLRIGVYQPISIIDPLFELSKSNRVNIGRH